MGELIGRFHPLLVHLPIGILLLAILFELLPSRKSYRSLKRSIVVILTIGSVSAILSSITGYMLSQNGDYDSRRVAWHQWMAISLTIYSLGYVWMRSRKGYKSYRKAFAFILLTLLMITGHLGGSLTHGEGYLSPALVSTSSSPSASEVDMTHVNLQQALYYNDLVKPILEERCYGCHGSTKQKGKLRLDAPEYILKGGKDGEVVKQGRADESEMIHRLLLSLDDEDHMPPKEKPQPSEKEILILKMWINSGADFKKSVTESGQLVQLEKIISSKETENISDVPTGEPPVADEATIAQLRKSGVVILPVANGSNYLSLNLINTMALDSAINAMGKLKEQIIWIKTGGQPVTDSHLAKLNQLNKLTRLSLDHSKISDAGLVHLKSLTQLQYLNLNGTNITAEGLSKLSGLAHLTSIYIYQTQIKNDELASLRKSFPQSVIEAGNYTVPLLQSDTVVAKAPK